MGDEAKPPEQFDPQMQQGLAPEAAQQPPMPDQSLEHPDSQPASTNFMPQPAVETGNGELHVEQGDSETAPIAQVVEGFSSQPIETASDQPSEAPAESQVTEPAAPPAEPSPDFANLDTTRLPDISHHDGAPSIPGDSETNPPVPGGGELSPSDGHEEPAAAAPSESVELTPPSSASGTPEGADLAAAHPEEEVTESPDNGLNTVLAGINNLGLPQNQIDDYTAKLREAGPTLSAKKQRDFLAAQQERAERMSVVEAVWADVMTNLAADIDVIKQAGPEESTDILVIDAVRRNDGEMDVSGDGQEIGESRATRKVDSNGLVRVAKNMFAVLNADQRTPFDHNIRWSEIEVNPEGLKGITYDTAIEGVKILQTRVYDGDSIRRMSFSLVSGNTVSDDWISYSDVRKAVS